MSFMIMSIILLYAANKFKYLYNKDNPTITAFLKEAAYDENDSVDLYDLNFKVAFAVEGFRTKDLKVDPKYVKWFFRIFGKENDVEYEKILPYHKCTEEDYAEFLPIR